MYWESGTVASGSRCCITDRERSDLNSSDYPNRRRSTLNVGSNAISQSGVIAAADDGAVSHRGAITLTQANVLGEWTVKRVGAGAVSSTENEAISIAAITRTDGDLTLNVGSNAISQSGVIAVDDGAVSLTGGADHIDPGRTGEMTVAEWSRCQYH